METTTPPFELNEDIPVSTYPVFHEILFGLFCIAATCTDVIIIHILFRYRRMHTIPYKFSSNWIIADGCYLFILALTYIISAIIQLANSVNTSIHYNCALIEMEVAIYFATIYFAGSLLIDWYIAAYFKRYSDILRNYYKLIIGFIWIFSVMFWGITTGMCFKTDSYTVVTGYNIFIVCFLLFFIIAINIYTIMQKIQHRLMEYPTLMLTLTSIFILSRIPEYIHYLVYLIFDYHSTAFTLVFTYVTPLHSILNLFLLYWLDKDFQACLRQFLKRSDQEYMEATDGFENPDENEDHQEFPVRISLNNSNEALSPTS